MGESGRQIAPTPATMTLKAKRREERRREEKRREEKRREEKRREKKRREERRREEKRREEKLGVPRLYGANNTVQPPII